MSRKLFVLQITIGIVFNSSLLFLRQTWASDSAPLVLNTFKTHSRLIFRLDEAFPTKLSKNKKGFKLQFQGMTFNDLGMNSEEAIQWKGVLKSLHDPRLASLEAQEIPEGVVISGTWKYPVGQYELAEPGMECFDYQDPQSAQFLLDFWYKPGPTVVQKKEEDKKAQVHAFFKKLEQEGRKRIARQLASVKQADDHDLVIASCQKPLSESSHIFVKLLPTHPKVDFSSWLPGQRPDEKFTYIKPGLKNSENSYVRLAIRFYEAGKTALALRAIEFFEHEVSKSVFQDQMRFLKANALIKLGLHKEADQILSQIMTEARGSLFAVHSAQYLTRKLIESKSHLPALQNFIWLIENDHRPDQNWVYHLGAAEMLYALGETDRAAKEYRWVMENAPEEKSRAEAAYRTGDLYLVRQQYEQALLSYYHASQYFKNYSDDFPEALLNKGEVYYQLAQWDQAQSLLEQYLKKFPHHSAGWKATLRLAEIHARESQGKGEEDQRYRDGLYETINRYPYSPGATLARLSLLPCGDHGNLDPSAAMKFLLNEQNLEVSTHEVLHPTYEGFKSLTKVRSFLTLSHEGSTVELAVREYQHAQDPQLKKILVPLAHAALRKRMHFLLKQKKTFEAVSEYTQVFHQLPAPEQTLDFDYLIQLSEAASDLGLTQVASDIIQNYHQMAGLKRLPASGQLESAEKMRLLVQESEVGFARAKSKWIELQGTEPKEGEYHWIRNELLKVSDESALSYEREVILGLMDERQNKLTDALSHAQRAQLLKKSMIIDAWIAALESKLGHLVDALAIYQNLEKRLTIQEDLKADTSAYLEKSLGVKGVESLENLYIEQARINEQLGKWNQAQVVYEKAMSKGLNSNRIQFNLARCLYQGGQPSQMKRAQDLLKKISESPSTHSSDEFWRGLATEVLKNRVQLSSILNQAKEGE